MLAYCYLEGLGGAVDYGKAIGFFEKSARLGDAPSQYMLGYMYAKGLGVKKDHTKVMYWMRSAAAQGNVQALAFMKAIEQK